MGTTERRIEELQKRLDELQDKLTPLEIEYRLISKELLNLAIKVALRVK